MKDRIHNDGLQPLREGHQPLAKIVTPSNMIKGLQPTMSTTPPPPPPPTLGNVPVAKPKK